MKAFNVIFKSGTSAVLYGKTREEALESMGLITKTDAIIDVIANLEREKKFKQEHEPFLQSIAVLDAIQKVKGRKAAEEQAKAQGLIPKRAEDSPLTRL